MYKITRDRLIRDRRSNVSLETDSNGTLEITVGADGNVKTMVLGEEEAISLYKVLQDFTEWEEEKSKS